MSFPAQFIPPPTVFPPTQADQGAQTYYYVCLVCHGDQGQGLDAWRKKLDPADNNCWQSKCHSPNHMDFGFTFPHDVPAVRNPGMMMTFENAYNLYVFVKTKMPWQAPNSLTDSQYWQLTAFLMRLNGVDLGPRVLDTTNARAILLRPVTPPPSSLSADSLDSVFAVMGGVLILGITAGIVVLLRRRV